MLVLMGWCSQNLQAQPLKPRTAKRQLAGDWMPSKAMTLKVIDLCGECNESQLREEIDRMEYYEVNYASSGKVSTKGDGINFKGTYTLESIVDTASICAGIKHYGTVFRMTIFDDQRPDHGDKMGIVFMDKDTICILDTGCPLALIRKKR